MNIRDPKKYLTTAVITANRLFRLHKNTYLSNSISRSDLQNIAMNTAYDAMGRYSASKHRKGMSLKLYIRLCVSGKLYNIINRNCLHHNQIITFMPPEDLIIVSDMAGNSSLLEINEKQNLNEKCSKKDINYFDISELRTVLSRREYSFVVDYFVKGKSLKEMYKKYNFSWFLLAKFKEKITNLVKKFLIRSNYDLSSYDK